MKPIFKWNLRVLSDLLVRTLNNKYDFVVAIEGKRGCLTGDTIIKTPYGNKKISDMKEVDILNAYDFKKEKVVESFAKKINSGVKDIYEIETNDGRIIKASSNHIFYVKRSGKIIELPLRKLDRGYPLLCIDNNFTKIKSIKKIGKEQVYDFKVPNYNNFVLGNNVVVHNSGKCLIEDTKIMGTKQPLKHFKENDIINTYSWDFKKNKIVKSKSKIIESGEKELYKVKLENGKEVICSKDHKLFVLRKDNIIELQLKDIKEDDKLICQ